MATKKGRAAQAEAALRAFGLSFPGAYEDYPWGERVLKVNKKVFLFMGISDGGLSLSTKLPASSMAALSLPFTRPTGYGLGKAGWVSSRFEPEESPPVEVLRSWIVESYEAVAPKKLVEAWRSGVGAPAVKKAAGKKAAGKKAAGKKAAVKKAVVKKAVVKKAAVKKAAVKKR